MRRRTTIIAALLAACTFTRGADAIPLWEGTAVRGRLLVPTADPHGARLVRSTINGYLRESYGIELPIAERAEPGGLAIVAGTAETNPTIAQFVKNGLALVPDALGDEGFQLLSHAAGGITYVVVHGKTPRALKHGCQELVFFRTPASAAHGEIELPLAVVMTPAIRYRGTYMLPCWSAHDSYESWERVIRFNSELTLNRNWFWLDGFPLAGHTGEYAGTALASRENVQRLLDLAHEEDMKILIGGGWFNWHHEKAVGKNFEKGVEYYLAYLDAFKRFDGFYIEPTGEGSEINNWRPEGDALCDLIAKVHARQPHMEFALAIGKFNNKEYLARMAALDPARVFWWWCWGDPLRDKALELYPSVLRWHTVVRMSDYHGSMDSPRVEEKALAGIATSYDPGQGFGNPWNGWGKLGADTARNVDPRTIPYFAHEYFFRERCWNPAARDEEITARLQRRLFDADADPTAAALYVALSTCVLALNQGKAPTPTALAPLRAFMTAAGTRAWTPKMRASLEFMGEALGQCEQRANRVR